MTNDANGLGAMFSDSAREKFARVTKPAEFVKTKRPAREEDENDSDNEKKKKKPKHAKRQMIAEAAKLGKTVEELAAASAETKTSAHEANEAAENAATAIDQKYEEKNRTIFVGNLPVSATVKSVTKFFRNYGEVNSVRLRSVPIAGTAVDEKGNQELVRKVCVNQRKFGDQKGSFNAYVVFKEESSAAGALEANNTLIDKRHIRVDTATPTIFNPKKTVFLGALSYYADEEELREHFASVLPNGQDDIDAVRIVRDNETLVGKGFGYISFKSAENVLQALGLHESKFKKRVIRVTTCGKKTKREEHRKMEASGQTPKKSMEPRQMAANALAAVKRLRAKKSSSAKGANKGASKGANKPKKSKQVSGSVKKAIKQMKIAQKQSKSPKKR